MGKSFNLQAADNIRILSAAMVEQAKSGHPGGPMGGADFVQILYADFLRFDPDDPTWAHRDRFFLDPGHLSAMLYSVLGLVGNFTLDELKAFRQWGSPTPGHPEYDIKRGIENTSGPLGQGHVNGVGAAIAERFLAARFGEWLSHRTFCYISDGGIQEEISQGAGRIAGFLGLGNLTMFFDANNIQLSTKVDEVTDEDTAAKYKAWGWHVVTVNGHDHAALSGAIQAGVDETDRPTLIIGQTTMGKGAVTDGGDSFEHMVSTHGQPLSKAGASIGGTIANLGGDPENPFMIFDEVKKGYDQILDEKRALVKEQKDLEAAWRSSNPDLAKQMDGFLNGDIPNIDFETIAQGADSATRNASKNVLANFADTVKNMIVSSADLSNSDKTDGFLKKTTAFSRHNFEGAFLHPGVAELTMATICNGMALHGGIIPVCATFFVFSDYMKPAIRLACLMELPVKYVWTHDAFRVGEDGPTHQPVEHEAQIRLMEQLHNHSGKRSMLVLRPADGPETSVAWKMALENTTSPSCLILSRQNIVDLPALPGKSRYESALGAEKGAYVAYESEGGYDVILVASGSEVATLYAGGQLLEAEGIKVRIVSAISEGKFRDQDAAYQAETLPRNKPTFGMTAGLPVNLQGLVGPFGEVHGLTHFGYSAPYTVLDEKFGYTPENVLAKVKNYLENFSMS